MYQLYYSWHWYTFYRCFVPALAFRGKLAQLPPVNSDITGPSCLSFAGTSSGLTWTWTCSIFVMVLRSPQENVSESKLKIGPTKPEAGETFCFTECKWRAGHLQWPGTTSWALWSCCEPTRGFNARFRKLGKHHLSANAISRGQVFSWQLVLMSFTVRLYDPSGLII